MGVHQASNIWTLKVKLQAVFEALVLAIARVCKGWLIEWIDFKLNSALRCQRHLH